MRCNQHKQSQKTESTLLGLHNLIMSDLSQTIQIHTQIYQSLTSIPRFYVTHPIQGPFAP